MPFGSRKAQFFFIPELIYSSDQKLDLKLDLKNETIETLQMEMEAEGQMRNIRYKVDFN